MTDDEWRAHFARLDDYLDRIEARVDRMIADLDTWRDELTRTREWPAGQAPG
jgi:hypothetical protein